MTNTSSQTVLILGGGIGGVAAANRLRKHLDCRHRIVLVNRKKDFSFAASYLWVMNGSRQPEQVIRPLKRLELENIEPGQLHFGNEKERTDLLIYLPPITAPKTIAESALAINLKSSRTLGQGSFRTQRDETLVVIH